MKEKNNLCLHCGWTGKESHLEYITLSQEEPEHGEPIRIPCCPECKQEFGITEVEFYTCGNCDWAGTTHEMRIRHEKTKKGWTFPLCCPDCDHIYFEEK